MVTAGSFSIFFGFNIASSIPLDPASIELPNVITAGVFAFLTLSVDWYTGASAVLVFYIL